MKFEKNLFSFASTCMDRLSFAKETLAINLNAIENINAEIVLLNYNSLDGLHEWVRDNFMPYIKSGKLKYAVERTAPYFSFSHSKNVAYKLCKGNIFCNLDIDCFLTTDLIFAMQNNYLPYCSPVLNNGAGLITCTREKFYEVNGYNEEFKGWGYEDMDFLFRLHRANCNIIVRRDIVQYIPHSDEERMKNTDPKHLHKRVSSKINRGLMKENNKKRIIRANVDKEWGKAVVEVNFENEVSV